MAHQTRCGRFVATICRTLTDGIERDNIAWSTRREVEVIQNARENEMTQIETSVPFAFMDFLRQESTEQTISSPLPNLSDHVDMRATPVGKDVIVGLQSSQRVIVGVLLYCGRRRVEFVEVLTLTKIYWNPSC
ncbi:hypothetical protein RB195_020169 [Necator americanus]|uniref:Uncharacterized protein n=1 Tax=Necator americanus TaxID=51031 RepID=A0ABR1CL43_NECAM